MPLLAPDLHSILKRVLFNQHFTPPAPKLPDTTKHQRAKILVQRQSLVMAGAALSEDQSKVYDRQLRVWGVEVQKRLTAAKVLLIGFGELAAEVAKNIVLAGVGHVALLDGRPSQSFIGRNFLVAASTPLEQNVVDAAVSTLQAMNPLVRVSALPGTPADCINDPSVLKPYDLVIVTAQPLGVMMALDAACSQLGVKFMAGAVQGYSSFFFLNLLRHEFMPKADPDNKDQPVQQQVLEYSSMQAAMSVPLANLAPGAHPLYPVLQACAAFEAEQGRPPASADAGVLEQQLQDNATSQDTVVAPATLQLLLGFLGEPGEFAPVCAIVGGVMANNVIKAVSQSDAPLKNMFFYAMDGRGLVEELPPQQQGSAAASAANGHSQGKQAKQEVIEIEL